LVNRDTLQLHHDGWQHGPASSSARRERKRDKQVSTASQTRQIVIDCRKGLWLRRVTQASKSLTATTCMTNGCTTGKASV